MTLFNYFEFNTSDRSFLVQVAPMFEYVVNKLTANFPVYELAEFTNLRSTYSKTMYRILKQWKSLGEKEFKIEQFRELLDIPKSYNTSAITRQIIQPIEKELPQYFEGLKVKSIKKNTQGTPFIGYKFTWKKQLSNGQFVPSKYNKKSNSKELNLFERDNRMTKEERVTFIEEKLKRKLPIPTKNKNSEKEELSEGQLDVSLYI